MKALRALLGMLLGAGIAFGSVYFSLHFVLQLANTVVFPVAGIAAAMGGAYSAFAFGEGIYGFGPLSILGYLLDMSWSLLNIAASLVWMLACKIVGGSFVPPTDDSRRSGTFVYDKNPRGTGWVTTIGTVIGGEWSSHEEVHVWQARIFGPLYLLTYGLSLLLNMLFRLCAGQTKNIGEEAYYRVCFEDWAYSAGQTSGKEIDAGSWILWFFVSSVYVGSVVLLTIGAFTGNVVLRLGAAIALVAYGVIRALMPRKNQSAANAETFGGIVASVRWAWPLTAILVVGVVVLAWKLPAAENNGPPAAHKSEQAAGKTEQSGHKSKEPTPKSEEPTHKSR
jgi:hypothetical protein